MIDDLKEIRLEIPKIKNGAKIRFGKLRSVAILVDHHFN